MENVSLVKNEFIKWLYSLDKETLNETDKKLLNLLLNNFEDIVSLPEFESIKKP